MPRMVTLAPALLLLVACEVEPMNNVGSVGDEGGAGGGGASTGGRVTGGAAPGGADSGGTPSTGGTAGSEDGGNAGTGGTTLAEVCTLPYEPGDCGNDVTNYWHDPATGLCTPVRTVCSNNANLFGTREDCQAACRGVEPGLTEFDRCESAADCMVAITGCCGSCEPVPDYTLVGIRADLGAQYTETKGCTGVACGACWESALGDVTSKYYYPACESGQCTVRDARTTPVTECADGGDCILRCGTRCCSSCGDGSDVVALSANGAAETDELCDGQTPTCPTCDCTFPETARAVCDAGRCVVAGLPVCIPGSDQTCNSDPLMSSVAGTCNDNATCTCAADRTQDPDTGKCY